MTRLRGTVDGGASLDAAAVARFAAVLAPLLSCPLTRRESLILYLRVVKLRRPKEIAEALTVTESDVRAHLFHAAGKLGVHGIGALEPLIAAYAFAAGRAAG